MKFPYGCLGFCTDTAPWISMKSLILFPSFETSFTLIARHIVIVATEQTIPHGCSTSFRGAQSALMVPGQPIRRARCARTRGRSGSVPPVGGGVQEMVPPGLQLHLRFLWPGRPGGTETSEIIHKLKK